MRTIHFHAVTDDLLLVVDAVEGVGPLNYVQTGNFLKSDLKDGITIFGSGRDIPNLGKATADSSSACESFLVCENGAPIALRTLEGSRGLEHVLVDQLVNPDTIVFKPGGIWGEDVLLEGEVGTSSDSEASQRLMKRFETAIRKYFTKVKAFYVGPKALALLKLGKRLTLSIHSPREFDLAQ